MSEAQHSQRLNEILNRIAARRQPGSMLLSQSEEEILSEPPQAFVIEKPVQASVVNVAPQQNVSQLVSDQTPRFVYTIPGAAPTTLPLVPIPARRFLREPPVDVGESMVVSDIAKAPPKTQDEGPVTYNVTHEDARNFISQAYLNGLLEGFNLSGVVQGLRGFCESPNWSNIHSRLQQITAEEVRAQTETGIHVSVVAGFIVFAVFLYSYGIRHVQQYIPLVYIKGLSLAMLPLFLIYNMKVQRKSLVIGAQLVLALFLSQVHDTTFTADDGVNVRFNYHVYQSMERYGRVHDPKYTGMDPFFSLRKIVLACTHDITSDVCKKDIAEGQRVSLTTMIAMRKVLADSSIVSPRNVILKQVHGMPIFINFDDYVYHTQLSENVDLFTRDQYETKLCALMALRLHEGIHYDIEYRTWLDAGVTVRSLFDMFMSGIMIFTCIDKHILPESAHTLWTWIKLFSVTLQKFFDYLCPNISSIEHMLSWPGFSKRVKRMYESIDPCTVDRCFDNVTSNVNYVRSFFYSESRSISKAVAVYQDECTDNFDDVIAKGGKCYKIANWCIQALDKMGNKLSPWCPEHCKNVLYLNKDELQKRCEEQMRKLKFDYSCPARDSDRNFVLQAEQSKCTTPFCTIYKYGIDAGQWILAATGSVFATCLQISRLNAPSGDV
jgi:hypothetical protein